MDEKHVSSDKIRELLEEKGFDMLTGESCGIGMRWLYDVSPNAQSILFDFFGGQVKFDNPAWNRAPETGWRSVMLPPELMRSIAIYTLLRDYEYVIDVQYRGEIGYLNYLHAINGTSDEVAAERERRQQYFPDSVKRIYHRFGTAGKGMRNRHEWTGRVA